LFYSYKTFKSNSQKNKTNKQTNKKKRKEEEKTTPKGVYLVRTVFLFFSFLFLFVPLLRCVDTFLEDRDGGNCFLLLVILVVFSGIEVKLDLDEDEDEDDDDDDTLEAGGENLLFSSVSIFFFCSWIMNSFMTSCCRRLTFLSR